MSETIRDGKFVGLTYKVTDKKSGHVLTMVEFPLGYVHGHNEILAPSVHRELEGKSAGDVIDVPIDGNQIFGPRDEFVGFYRSHRQCSRGISATRHLYPHGK